jgi:hypothetical protein
MVVVVASNVTHLRWQGEGASNMTYLRWQGEGDDILDNGAVPQMAGRGFFGTEISTFFLF